MSIFIFSKPIHSGKTTALMQWCKWQNNCAGILMPNVDGVRKMYDIKSDILFDAECKKPSSPNEALVSIGNYHFYNDAFTKANEILINALQQSIKYIIIDEVGKLELDKKGFYPSVKESFESIANNEFNGNLLLVVRDTLLNEVATFFDIKKFELIDKV